MIAFGPIPSRRLGLSLGINNIVSRKVCSYNCVYCQIGETQHQPAVRKIFYKPEILVENVMQHLEKLDEKHRPDYLTFVSNGEPTLDLNLGREIRLLKKSGIPVAVITNASLLYQKNIRNGLMEADWVSVKVDSVDEEIWKKINRPSVSIKLNRVLEGIRFFADEFKGSLQTETMLLNGFNDSPEQVEKTALFIEKMNPNAAYLSIPTRPPAVKEVKSATEKDLTIAWQIFRGRGIKTELLTGFEGTDTGYTGNAYEDILNITAVHPLRQDSLEELLKKEHADILVVDSLIYMGLLKKINYDGNDYYLRNYHL